MAKNQSALPVMVDALKSVDDGELMRRLLAMMLQKQIDAEATSVIEAGLHERSAARTTQRNGARETLLTTGLGDVTVRIPKTRTGSFFPALLAPRRRIDVALHAVIMQAYVEGVSTRRVDDLVVALGGTGIGKSEVSRICGQLDTQVAAWRTRPLDEAACPYVFTVGTHCKVRAGGRVVSQAVFIATGLRADGHREVLGCAVGDNETEAFWAEFLTDLCDRGLTASSSSSQARTAAPSRRSAGSCNAPHGSGAGSTSCATPGPRPISSPTPTPRSPGCSATLGPPSPRSRTSPQAHWAKTFSTNLIERLNKELKQRIDVVGIFPNTAALPCLSLAVLIEHHDQ